MNFNDYKDYFSCTSGKTIAIVYIFEGETSSGFEHYDIWKSDVISEWLMAVHQNNCIPLIMDVRSFVAKAMNSQLPHIDYVLNLNAGNTELSTLSMVPSVCSFLDIPCIPCNAVSIVSGENKVFSNTLAKSIGINTPECAKEGNEGIYRPINYGSSRGTKKQKNIIINKSGIYQKFIKGYDITTPILYHPIHKNLEVLPSVMYYPSDLDIDWFLNEEAKEVRGGYKKRTLQIDPETVEQFIRLAAKIEISCYCRIDSRIKCESAEEWKELFQNPVSKERIYFIEINPMPTLKPNINFYNSLNSLSVNDSFYEIYQMYKAHHESPTPTGFILMCSMLSFLKPCIKEKWIDSVCTDKIQSNP